MKQGKDNKFNRLDNILSGLNESYSLEKSTTKTVSVRMPVIDLARIDVLAGMKDVSRNVLLNDIIEASLAELMDKLSSNNPALAQQLNEQAAQLAKTLLNEAQPPHKKPKPHHGPKKKHASESR